MFARFKQKENIEAVERYLATKTELELFERSQLGKKMLVESLVIEAQALLSSRVPRQPMLRISRRSQDADPKSNEQD